MNTICIESPLSGAFARNIAYARACMLHCLSRGDAPFVSHLLYTQVLDDSRPDHRRRGIVAGLAMGDTCEERWFFTDLGMSTGMREGQKRAIACNQKHRTIKIGDDWREKYPGKPTQGFADAARVAELEKAARAVCFEPVGKRRTTCNSEALQALDALLPDKSVEGGS